jgi:hypothetical protein
MGAAVATVRTATGASIRSADTVIAAIRPAIWARRSAVISAVRAAGAVVSALCAAGSARWSVGAADFTGCAVRAAGSKLSGPLSAGIGLRSFRFRTGPLASVTAA